MSISPIRTPSPFKQLAADERRMIGSKVINKANANYFQPAVGYFKLNPPMEFPLPEVQAVITALEDKAQEFVEEPYVKPLKAGLPYIKGSIELFTHAAHAAAAGVVVAGGMALYYSRSRRAIALANACAAGAFFLLNYKIRKFKVPLTLCSGFILELKWNNQKKTSDLVDALYKGLKKTNYPMGPYLNAHQSKMNEELQGLTLLREQLSAIHHIIRLVKKPFLREAPAQESIEIKEENLPDIKAFFLKFEKLCRRGVQGSLGIAMIAFGCTYYAYVQKANRMTVVGMVHFIGALALSHRLYKFQRISSNINQLSEVCKIKEAIQKAFSESFLLRPENPANINSKSPVVIPIDAILKLIPAWKTEKPNLDSSRKAKVDSNC